MANIFYCDKIEFHRIVWRCLSELSSKAGGAHYGFGQPGSVHVMMVEQAQAKKLLPESTREHREATLHVVRVVLERAKGMGLIVRHEKECSQWGFYFTKDGVEYFENGDYVRIDDPGALPGALREVRGRHPEVTEAMTSLLVDAQLCLYAGIPRAAAVLVGVSCEDVCTKLLNALVKNLLQPSDPKLSSDFGTVEKNPLFAYRWKPGMRILEALKKKLDMKTLKADQKKWWSTVPNALGALTEAVRITRNGAAHDTSPLFGKPEAAMLLAALPVTIEAICELTTFLDNPLVTLPKL